MHCQGVGGGLSDFFALLPPGPGNIHFVITCQPPLYLSTVLGIVSLLMQAGLISTRVTVTPTVGWTGVWHEKGGGGVWLHPLGPPYYLS